MKKILLILFSTFFFGFAQANSKMQEANDLYGQQKFEEAIAIYEAQLANNLESHELYFNLANAYFRVNKNTLAILNYERALLLEPNDEATMANLSIARLQVVDKFDSVPEFFLNTWFGYIYRWLTPTTWAVLSMLLFAMCILALLAYFFSKNVAFRKAGFYSASIALLLTVFCIFFASKHNGYLNNHQSAIVNTPALTVISAPNDSGSELFVVHEGTKVKVTKELNDWREIKVEDGRVGWVKETDILRI